MINNEFEVLAPAGSFEILQAVVEAGADAVYVGGSQFGARAYANNFDQDELLRAIDYTHLRDRQLYLTVNTLMKNKEIENNLYEFLVPYYQNGLDAVIVQDFGALQLIRREFPNLAVHTSTQMTVTGAKGACLMKELGATRIVTARELSLSEIKKIHEEVDIEIETFVHGALCYCYSGQCLLSSMLGGRSGNRGRCAQPCRLAYSVFDKQHKEILKDSYVLSPKDLCAIDLIPEMYHSGIYSLKIEGRMKQAQYAAGVVALYRKYVDLFLENKDSDFSITPKDKKEIYDLGNRSGFTNAYFTKHNGKDMITFEKPNHQKSNNQHLAEVSKKYIEQKKQLPITGELFLTKGKQSTLIIKGSGIQTTTIGMEVNASQNKPLEKEAVYARFCKTGDTDFYFETLDIHMDSDIFLPVGAMNQLRRDALTSFKDALLKQYRRELPAQTAKKNSTKENICSISTKQRIICSTENRNLIPLFLNNEYITDIYIDPIAYPKDMMWEDLQKDIALIHSADKKIYFMLPAVFRSHSLDYYERNLTVMKKCQMDGFVLRNYEEIMFAKKYLDGFDFILDHNLYTYNNQSIQAFSQLGFAKNTIPIELNKKEIAHRYNHTSDMIIYGNYTLMTSAQCVHCNTQKCDHTPGIMYLQDRYQKQFPVRNYCGECYNVIYNSLPVLLFDQYQDLITMGIKSFRLNFTMESPKETSYILGLLKKTLENNSYSGKTGSELFTNGHYKRGVE